jgi:hypothetical protein
VCAVRTDNPPPSPLPDPEMGEAERPPSEIAATRSPGSFLAVGSPSGTRGEKLWERMLIGNFGRTWLRDRDLDYWEDPARIGSGLVPPSGLAPGQSSGLAPGLRTRAGTAALRPARVASGLAPGHGSSTSAARVASGLAPGLGRPASGQSLMTHRDTPVVPAPSGLAPGHSLSLHAGVGGIPKKKPMSWKFVKSTAPPPSAESHRTYYRGGTLPSWCVGWWLVDGGACAGGEWCVGWW